jgi:hypothetical protein
VTRSRIRGSVHPLLPTSSWRSALLAEYRDNFTFTLLVVCGGTRSQVVHHTIHSPLLLPAIKTPVFAAVTDDILNGADSIRSHIREISTRTGRVYAVAFLHITVIS